MGEEREVVGELGGGFWGAEGEGLGGEDDGAGAERGVGVVCWLLDGFSDAELRFREGGSFGAFFLCGGGHGLVGVGGGVGRKVGM